MRVNLYRIHANHSAISNLGGLTLMLVLSQRVPLFAAILLCLSWALSACGSSDVQPATGDDKAATAKQGDSKKPASGMPTDDQVEQVFTALATDNVSALETAVNLTEKGSVARAYVDYNLAFDNAAIDGGQPFDESPPPTKVKGRLQGMHRRQVEPMRCLGPHQGSQRKDCVFQSEWTRSWP